MELVLKGRKKHTRYKIKRSKTEVKFMYRQEKMPFV